MIGKNRCELRRQNHIIELYLEMRSSPIAVHLIIRVLLLRVITILLVHIMARVTTNTAVHTRAQHISGNKHHVRVSLLATMAVHLTYIHPDRPH